MLINLGIYMNSFVCVAQTFSIRNTMASPKKMPRVVIVGFLLVLSLFLTGGIICYNYYGNEYPHKMLLDAFDGMKFYFVLNMIFNIVTMLWVPFLLVSIAEQMENFKWFKDWINEESTTKYIGNYQKIFLMRFIVGTVVLLIGFFSDDFLVFMEFNGVLMCPLASFMIPIILLHSREWVAGRRKSCGRILHDVLLILFGVVFMSLSLYSLLNS